MLCYADRSLSTHHLLNYVINYSFTSEVGGTDVFPKLLIQKGWEYSSEWCVSYSICSRTATLCFLLMTYT